ncbi:MAG: DUF2589 domain-containing protein [Emcibacteraceae bacterium]|nr:DUF2589 domain-containing protein [Emcibacteraceae bacterium]
MDEEQSGQPSEPSQSSQLSNIDFSQILGGPMSAAVVAEAQAAMVTLNYIEKVGFKKGTDGSLTAVEVDFNYEKDITKSDGTPGTITEKMSVPVLSIVPIPALQVSQLSVDLNVKLSNVTSNTSSNSIVKKEDASASPGIFASLFEPVSLSCHVTDRNVSTGLSKSSEQYTLQVKMLATQAPVPTGLGKVLSIFEKAIEPQTSKSAT